MRKGVADDGRGVAVIAVRVRESWFNVFPICDIKDVSDGGVSEV